MGVVLTESKAEDEIMIIPGTKLSNDDGQQFPTFWIPRRRDIFLIARFFQLCGCREVLDLGCGNGFLSSASFL